MSEILISANKFGIFADNHDTARISSLDIAQKNLERPTLVAPHARVSKTKKMPCYDIRGK